MPQELSADDILNLGAAPRELSAEDIAGPSPSTPAPAPVAPPVQELSADAIALKHKVDEAKGFESHLPTRDEIARSPVGRALQQLAKPEEFVAGRLAAMIPGAKQALNPQGQWFPEIAYHDVLNYVTPDGEKVLQALQEWGLGPKASAGVAAAYQSVRTGVGIAADILGDPLMWVRFGTLTKGAQEARSTGSTIPVTESTLADRTAGQFVDNSRNLVEIVTPIKAKPLASVSTEPLERSIDFAGRAIRKVPGGGKVLDAATSVKNTAHELLDYFDYRTGIPEVDMAASRHAGLKRGDQQFILENFFTPLKKANLSESENRVLSAAIEATGNTVGTQELATEIGNRAKTLGLTVNPERVNQMAEVGARIKQENNMDLAERVSAGLVEDPKSRTIENYLVHKISPEAAEFIRKAKNKNSRISELLNGSDPAEMAAAIEEARLQKQVNSVTKGSQVSTYDSGSFKRGLRTTLDQANEYMRAKTGVQKWFIEDPVLATAMKRAETRKLIRDKELLDVASKYAVVPSGVGEMNQLRKLGYANIAHPELAAKGYSANGKSIVTAMYPKEIASKLGYYITPREVGNISAFIDSYNRVFRTFALAKPDYHVQNWGENLLKNYVQGVKLEDYADALKVNLPRASKLTGASDADRLSIMGKTVSSDSVRADVARLGIHTGGQFREGLRSVIFSGKKLWADQNLAQKAGTAGKYTAGGVFHLLEAVGTRGENLTRTALYINRLKRGFAPEAAAFEVERWLFDFSRNSRATDVTRRFVDPFIQAAIKTAFITPELLASRPGAYSAQVTLLKALERSFNDPATVDDVARLMPPYQAIQDRYVGPLLPGNHWLVAGAIPKDGLIGKAAMLFSVPIGPDILNKFALFDPQVLQQNSGVSQPILRGIGVLLTGQDPWSGKDIDIAKNSPDISKRLQAAVVEAMKGALPFPNTSKFILQKLKIGDPQYFTPDALLLLQGGFGKFVTVLNLDREFLFRQITFASIRKEILGKFVSAVRAEAGGRILGDEWYGNLVNRWNKRYSNSAEIYQELMGQTLQASARSGAAQHLAGQLSSDDLRAFLRDLDRTISESNASYVTIRRSMMKSFQDVKAEDRDRMEQELRKAAEKQIAPAN